MVEYKGEIAHDKIYGVMRDYDVFISTSNFEGFGLSCAEAMSCGLPCVSSLIPGVTDWLLDYGKAGLCVPKTDVKTFADAIVRLSDSSFAEKVGVGGLLRIRELASFEAHGKKYAELVQAVSAQKNYVGIRPHCPIDHYIQPEFLKSWGPARLLPVWLKTWLRRFM